MSNKLSPRWDKKLKKKKITDDTYYDPEGVVTAKEDWAGARKYRNHVRVFADQESIQISLEGELRAVTKPRDVELVRGAVAEILDPALTGHVSLVMPDCDQCGQPLQISFCLKNASLNCNSR